MESGGMEWMGKLRHLDPIPFRPEEFSIGRDAHLRAVEPFKQHPDGDALYGRPEAELAIRRRHLHSHDQAVGMSPCAS